MAVLEVTGREAADPIAAIELCYSQGWTDGLPVIPPTDERVAAFLGHLKRSRDEVLGGVPERRRFVTVEQVAANAVMAGCLPEYALVVVAAVEAIVQTQVYLGGASGRLGGPAALLVGHWAGGGENPIQLTNNTFWAGETR